MWNTIQYMLFLRYLPAVCTKQHFSAHNSPSAVGSQAFYIHSRDDGYILGERVVGPTRVEGARIKSTNDLISLF